MKFKKGTEIKKERAIWAQIAGIELSILTVLTLCLILYYIKNMKVINAVFIILLCIILIIFGIVLNIIGKKMYIDALEENKNDSTKQANFDLLKEVDIKKTKAFCLKIEGICTIVICVLLGFIQKDLIKDKILLICCYVIFGVLGIVCLIIGNKMDKEDLKNLETKSNNKDKNDK